MIALINYPSKWIWPKLTIALGTGRNDRTAAHQGSGPKDPFHPGHLRLADRTGSEQEGEENGRCGSTKQKRRQQLTGVISHSLIYLPST